MQYKNISVLTRAVATATAIVLMPTIGLASSCGIDFQHAYETGVEDGRIDGAHRLSNDPSRARSNIFRNVDEGQPRAECFVEGYNIGYENASADDRRSHSNDGAPRQGTNERAYYEDGCRAGTNDAHSNMSRAYERHSDDYDTRFEPYFRQGYNACWNHYR